LTKSDIYFITTKVKGQLFDASEHEL